MNLQEVAFSSSSLQLSHGFDEWGTLNVSNSTTQLNDANIRCLLCIVDWDPRNSLDPILNGIGQMWHNLYSLSEVIASTLTLNDMLIDLSCGDVVFASECDVEIALIVSEVEVDFSSIIENKDFSMPTYRLVSSVLSLADRHSRRTRGGSWFRHRRSCKDRF